MRDCYCSINKEKGQTSPSKNSWRIFCEALKDGDESCRGVLIQHMLISSLHLTHPLWRSDGQLLCGAGGTDSN